MKIVFAKNTKDFNEWDNYILNTNRGNHLMLTDWLNSYKSYGFPSEIIFIKQNDKIVGGIGAVVAKFSFFKFYIIPYGPISDHGHDDLISIILEEAKKSAIAKNCCYFQFSVPKSDTNELRDFSYANNLEFKQKYSTGKLFKYIYCAEGVNYISLEKLSNSATVDEALQNFSPRTRRDIRIGIKNIDSVVEAKTEQEIEDAYNLCVLNSIQANYSIREWKDIRETVLNLVINEKALFLTAHKNEVLVGSIFLIKSGNHLTYVFGGSNKDYSTIYPGYALQWEAIKISIKLFLGMLTHLVMQLKLLN